MNVPHSMLSRRCWLHRGVVAASAWPAVPSLLTAAARAAEPAPSVSQVAITLDLEMSRNFPTWDDTHWDYEKGNLDQATKEYAVEAARRVRAAGGRVHFFVVGRVLEQENIDWLVGLAEAGHPLGNHTYDHVNVHASRLEDLQFRFQRAPWLVAGRQPAEVIAENIRLTAMALEARVGSRVPGFTVRGFRTPGGSVDGLVDRPDLQQMLLAQGYSWVSSQYPRHPIMPNQPPSEDDLQALVNAQRRSQPFRYSSGLVEIPMSPASDIVAFRTGRWPLEAFLEATRRSLSAITAERLSFDFLGHPSSLVAVDPEFRVIDLLCQHVRDSAGQALFATLDELAQRAGK